MGSLNKELRYSWLSLSTGSASSDSTNHSSKISEKKIPETSNSKTWICDAPSNYLYSICNFLHGIYIVLSIVSNVEMISSMWEDRRMCVAFVQILCHFIQGTWASMDFRVMVLDPVTHRYWGTAVLLKQWGTVEGSVEGEWGDYLSGHKSCFEWNGFVTYLCWALIFHLEVGIKIVF